MVGLATGHREEKTVMIDATYENTVPRPAWPPKRGARSPDRSNQGRHEHKTACHLRQQRPPLNLFVTAGQVSDYIGARALLSSHPNVEWLLGDRGYDADWFREALQDKGIRACIPGRKQRKKPVKYDKRRYKRRNRIEIMFGRLKDWRRVATAMTAVQRSFSQPSRSQQPSSTGYESDPNELSLRNFGPGIVRAVFSSQANWKLQGSHVYSRKFALEPLATRSPICSRRTHTVLAINRRWEPKGYDMLTRRHFIQTTTALFSATVPGVTFADSWPTRRRRLNGTHR